MSYTHANAMHDKFKPPGATGGSSESSSSSSSTKNLKAERLKGIGEGTDTCPYMIMIPPEKVGQVIGRGGATVSEIKAKSGCAKIDINQNLPPGVHSQIALTGSPEVIRVMVSLLVRLVS